MVWYRQAGAISTKLSACLLRNMLYRSNLRCWRLISNFKFVCLWIRIVFLFGDYNMSSYKKVWCILFCAETGKDCVWKYCCWESVTNDEFPILLLSSLLGVVTALQYPRVLSSNLQCLLQCHRLSLSTSNCIQLRLLLP